MNDGVDLNWKLTREEQEPLITKKEVDVDGEKTVIKSYKKLNEAIEKNMS
jgi:hypothetical protein